LIAPAAGGTAETETECSGGQKGRGLGGKEFLPALAFRRRRISYFALRNAPPREKMLCLPRPPLRAQPVFTPLFSIIQSIFGLKIVRLPDEKSE